MVKYLACGNIMSDIVEQRDGSFSEVHIGGPAMYALAGIRLWTTECKLVAQAGADYRSTYGKWMDDNGLTHESILTELEECTCHVLKYDQSDGGFSYTPKRSNEFLGYLKTHPCHIDAAATAEVQGIYMAQNMDRVVWKKLDEVKRKYDFKIMWEIEYEKGMGGASDTMQRIKEILSIAEMWSINQNEASDLFGIPREKDADILNELMKLPAELTLYRVGKRGVYAVTPANAYFCPSIDPLGASVDPTGCGNCSTGAAMYAHAAGYDPAMVAVMANIASGYNAAQYGPYPRFTREITDGAWKLAKELYKTIKENQER